jgi:hypothetical protein
MIKFFRHIRLNLINQNKTTKYFKYAIGEIVLVVIGILIALQFNNLNEANKKQLEIDQLLIDIEQDLLANYVAANHTLGFYKGQDSIAKLIASHKLSEEDYNKNNRLSYFVGNWDNYIPSEKNINQLIEVEKLLDSEYKPIIQNAKKIQFYSSVLYDTYSNLEANIDENVNRLASYTWFVKYDSISNQKRMAFMLRDTTYYTMAMSYWVMTQNYYDKISRYKAETMATLATIKRIRDEYSSENIDDLFQNNGMAPFVEYPCDINQKDIKSLKSLRSSELFGNYTQDTLQLYLTNNKGQYVNSFILPPSTFRSIPGSEYFGIDGDNNVFVEVQDQNGACIKKYGETHNGYLLIK